MSLADVRAFSVYHRLSTISKGGTLGVLMQAGKLRVLFVAPERLQNEMLLAALSPHLPLPLVVVDGQPFLTFACKPFDHDIAVQARKCFGLSEGRRVGLTSRTACRGTLRCGVGSQFQVGLLSLPLTT